jgi:Stigma-specific protein, Stig1
MATETTERSFDELAKGLATGTLSRGKALRWMGSAILGAALASFPGVALADDDCRRLGRECRRDSQCCSRNCVRRGDDKVCACPEGRTRCKDNCVNLETNERHCGECFNRCDDGEQCVRGECQGAEPICNPPCPEGESVCVQGPPGTIPFCDPICTPSCPVSPTGLQCPCKRSGDGSGNVCTSEFGGDFPFVSSCEQCPPTGFENHTICVNIAQDPELVVLACLPPCSLQA